MQHRKILYNILITGSRGVDIIRTIIHNEIMKKILIFVLGLLILVAIGEGVYYVYILGKRPASRLNQGKNNAENSPSTTLPKPPLPGWILYKNPKFKYQIFYPETIMPVSLKPINGNIYDVTAFTKNRRQSYADIAVSIRVKTSERSAKVQDPAGNNYLRYYYDFEDKTLILQFVIPKDQKDNTNLLKEFEVMRISLVLPESY